MDRHYRGWGIFVAIIFLVLCIPIVLTNVFLILFSYMGSQSSWGSYLGLGPHIILAILIVFISIRSIFYANLRLFIITELILVSMIAILIITFPFFYLYSFSALFYSLSGILQIRKFWRFSSPAITERCIKPATKIMAIALLIACANLGCGVARAMPKLPADKKGIKFVSGSLQFYDDWSRHVSLGQLAEEQEVQGILFPKDTFVFFDKSGKLSMVQLGERDMCVRIQGINCAGSGNIHFYRSGKLSSAVLAESQFINGKLYQKGASIGFNEDGSVEKSYEEQKNTLDEKERLVGIPNPAAVYCAKLGYKYENRKNEYGGEYCVVIFPDGTECGEWEFFRGKAGQRWSYCEWHGGKIENRVENMGTWTAEYAVCVFPDGSECDEMQYIDGKCGPGVYKKWSLDEKKCIRL